MAPKKRDRDNDNSKNRPTEQFQADHELFLNAFEKPTQIYRYLRTRNMISPIFLNRTLSYMRQRMSRSHKSRKGFKVNSLLDRLMDMCHGNMAEDMKGFMTLTFLGYFDKLWKDMVQVETCITKISHKKRKDSSAPLLKLFVGQSEVQVNPSESHPPSTAQAISIPAESFKHSNGNVIKSYILVLKVTHLSADSSDHINGNNMDSLEPLAKRQKTGSKEEKTYYTELTVYDKQDRCLLMTGDYEVGLKVLVSGTKMAAKKNDQWVTMSTTDGDEFKVFSKGPLLKFRLDWTTEAKNGMVEWPKGFLPIKQAADKENRPEKSLVTASRKREPQGLQIVYQFLYNNNSRQQTEACDDLVCPWCSLNCITLYSLLKHLQLCHSRFTFTYNKIPQGARIDVALNECYDGSYSGSPHDLISQPLGQAFFRSGPVRRTCVTHILTCRAKRPRPCLSEFVETEENDFDVQRPYITGHSRLYHHTTTCLPVYPKEMDVDSEGEHDPKWLQEKTIMMIDDFTDVNEGEKELMKLWNLHVMKQGYVGDCQIPLSCAMFLEVKGPELLTKGLYRNFLTHLCSMSDFALLSSTTMLAVVRQLQKQLRDNREATNTLVDQWRTQRSNWLSSGGQGGFQDKMGSNFMLFTPKMEPTHPKMTSSSTFITGDGTLRRKMTQQTPNTKMKVDKESEVRSSKNTSTVDTEPNKDRQGETEKKLKATEPAEVYLRKKAQNSPKRKESDPSMRRKSTSSAEQKPLHNSTNAGVQFRRKSTASVPTENHAS